MPLVSGITAGIAQCSSSSSFSSNMTQCSFFFFFDYYFLLLRRQSVVVFVVIRSRPIRFFVRRPRQESHSSAGIYAFIYIYIYTYYIVTYLYIYSMDPVKSLTWMAVSTHISARSSWEIVVVDLSVSVHLAIYYYIRQIRVGNVSFFQTLQHKQYNFTRLYLLSEGDLSTFSPDLITKCTYIIIPVLWLRLGC